jgi:hypothetical protein
MIKIEKKGDIVIYGNIDRFNDIKIYVSGKIWLVQECQRNYHPGNFF